MMIRLIKIMLNLSMLMITLLLGLIAGEGIVRLFIDPVDYLEPYYTRDEILGLKIVPGSGGHDKWGYRNKKVPEKAEIVTIGDSQTYGVSAPAGSSWPAWLAELSGQSVYNLSLGGYGPMQYAYLLEQKAFSLDPHTIVAGFYYGNDLMDTYGAVYTRSYWADLRQPGFDKEPEVALQVKRSRAAARDKNMAERQLGGTMREWLVHHSVLYRMAAFSAGHLFRFYEMKYGYADNSLTLYEHKEYDIQTGFSPALRLKGINLSDPRVTEGLRLSLETLRKMKIECEQRNIRFYVVLIPTKERVFAPLLDGAVALNNKEIIDEAIAYERRIDTDTKRFLKQHGISYIEVDAALSEALKSRQVYPNNIGDHPTGQGYAVIAQQVYKGLPKYKGAQ